MGQFEGGYTSAVNSQSERAQAEQTAAHLAQLIAIRAWAHQNDMADRQRDVGARYNAGSVLPQLFAPPPGMMPPPGMAAQAPMPGQASTPMMPPPPMGQSDMALDMPPGAPAPETPAGAAPEEPPPSPGDASAPQAAPIAPIGAPSWQTSPAALARDNQPPDAMQGEGATIGAPPARAPMKLPPQLTSAETAVSALKKLNLPPDQMLDALNKLEPLIQAQNRATLGQAKAETDALKAANAAYLAKIREYEAGNRALDTKSKIDRRTASADQGQQKIDLSKEALQSKMARASIKAASGSAQPEELTEGGLKVAAELSRAGLPLPTGYGAKGISRGNAILNKIALDEGDAAGSGDVAAGRASFKSDQASQLQRQRQVDALEAASKKIEKDINTMTSVMDKGVAGSVTLINEPLNKIRQKFSDPELTKYALAVKQVGVEYERMINGGLLSVAQLHEGARDDAAKIINESMTPEQVKAVIPIMLQEIANQRNAHHEQLDQIKERMRSTAAPRGAKAPAAAAAPTAPGADLEAQARDAISKGAPADAVRARYKAQTGKDLR